MITDEPNVGRKMDRVCFQCLAAVLSGSFHKRPGTCHIDRYGQSHDNETPVACLDHDGFDEKPAQRLVNDPAACYEKKDRLYQGRKVLDFSMAIRVVGVRRPVGSTNCEKRYTRSYKVESAVGRLRQDTQRASKQAYRQFETREENSRPY